MESTQATSDNTYIDTMNTETSHFCLNYDF